MNTVENQPRWNKFRVSRRSALAGAGGFALGAAATLVVPKLFSGKDENHKPSPDLSSFPEETIEHFRIGSTKFAFSKEFDPAKREQIRQAAQKFYPRFERIYAGEPIDPGGKIGVSCTFIPASEFQNFTSSTDFKHGLPQHNIRLANTFDESTVAESLSQLFWGPSQIGLEGKERYYVVQLGIINAAAELAQDQNQHGFKFLKRLFKLESFEPDWVNKEKTATYGSDLKVATGARRLLAALAMLEAIEKDPDFLPRFRLQYYKFVSNSTTLLRDLSYEALQQLLQTSYKESFRALQEKHKILSSARPGKHVLIAPNFDPATEEEALTVFVFERDSSGFIETPVQNAQVQVFISEGPNSSTAKRFPTDANGACPVFYSPDPAILQTPVEIVATVTSFGSDSVTIKPKNNNPMRA